MLLAETVQKVERPVTRELLPLPISLPENEVLESERIRGLSRVVRSCVKRRVGWQGWANAGVRSVSVNLRQNGDPGGRGSVVYDAARFFVTNLRCLSGDDRCRVQNYCGSLQSALRFCAWLHRNRCQTRYLQGGPRFPARPRREDDRWLCSCNRCGLGDWRRVLLRSPSGFHEVIAREGRVAPHTDPELTQKPQSYARLVCDMSLRGHCRSFLWSRRNQGNRG